MNSQNILWYVVLALGSVFVYDHWVAPKNTTTPIEITQPSIINTPISPQDSVVLTTPQARFVIERKTGNIISSSLLNFNSTLDSQDKVYLLDARLDNPLIVQVGLKDEDSVHFYVQNWNESTGGVLVGQYSNGLIVEKRYDVLDDGYTVKATIKVSNPTANTVQQQFVMKYLAERKTPRDGSGMPNASDFIAGTDETPNKAWFSFNTFTGLSYHDSQKPYTKVTYANIAQNPIKKVVREPWISIQKRYFVTAIIPSFDRAYELQSTWQQGVMGDSFYDQRMSFSLYSLAFDLKQGDVSQQEVRIFTGPEDAALLKTIAPKLDLTVDFGMFWILCDALLWLLQLTYGLTHNWGGAIILITLMLRVVFYRMSDNGYQAMQKMKAVNPKIKHLQELYKDDEVKKNQHILKLYKDEKINPLSGCLPAIIPLPFMMALYYVLLEAIELRHVSFLWLPDLSAPDPLFILPIIMTVAMYVQQSMTPVDDSQKSMMMVMPLMIGLMSLQFPSGLALFYFVNTVLGLAQQWWFIKRYNT